MNRRPIVGDIVHYHIPFLPCTAGIVTIVYSPHVVSLTLFPNSGLYPEEAVRRDFNLVSQDEDQKTEFTWHWKDHGLQDLVLPAPVPPINLQGRSTPEHYDDFDEILDVRGVSWRYIGPADVWVMIDPDGKQSKSIYRSYQRLVFELAPFIDKPR